MEMLEPFEKSDIKLGNQPATKCVYMDGATTYHMDPNDTELVEILVTDNLGRQRFYKAYASTTLAMLPIGDFGCIQFDIFTDERGAPIRDPENRAVFIQRVPILRSEVVEIADGFLQKSLMRIQMMVASGRKGGFRQ